MLTDAEQRREEWHALATADTLHLLPVEALVATIKDLAEQLSSLCFVYTYGDVEFEFLPYEGWQEDVRSAAVFLQSERPAALPAARLLGSFSPPAVKA